MLILVEEEQSKILPGTAVATSDSQFLQHIRRQYFGEAYLPPIAPYQLSASHVTPDVSTITDFFDSTGDLKYSTEFLKQ